MSRLLCPLLPGGLHIFYKLNINISRHKIRMIQNLILVIHICVDSFYNHFAKRAAHLAYCLIPVLGMHDQLRKHGTITDMYLPGG